MTEREIETLLASGNAVMWALAKSWMDAHEYRSVRQNAGQRKRKIELAIDQYRTDQAQLRGMK